MPTSNEPSIHDLREQSERNREALTATVEELRERVGDTADEIRTLVSPKHIKKEIRDYVREESETLMGSLQRKAKENPLQVAAIAAAVGYPALGLLRAVPAPLWLIGAGLFLTSRRGQRAANDLQSKVSDVVQQGTEKVSDLVGGIQSDLEDRIAGARYAVEDARGAVSSSVNSVANTAHAALRDARDTVTDAAIGITDKAKAATRGLGDKAAQTAETLKHQAGGMAKTSRSAATDFVNDNALLLAGVGAVVGAVIAASIPPSDAENRLFGAGSEKLKDKAREAAAQGIEKVSDIAAEAAGTVAAAAAREGLDASGVQDSLNKVADSVRTVADRGIDTALGNITQPTMIPNSDSR